MATTTIGRRLRPPSPNIDRSRSISSSISLPVSLNASYSSSTSSSSSSSPSNTSKRVMISRSHSTTRSSRPATGSNPKYGENIIPARNSASRSHEMNNGRSREAFAQYLEQRKRGSPLNNVSLKGVKPGGSSPSAWALSPGRVSTMKTSLSSSAPATSMCMTPPESPVSVAKIRSGGGGAVAGVLKYFRAQKKVSPVQEEDYHRFRVFQNRLLQWRFVNARTEATMANLKINVEDQLFWVWLRIYKMRNYVVENLIEVQRLRQEIKLRQVLSLQMPLLNEWSKLDAKNLEALSKLTRKLHSLSVRLPLLHGAAIDVVSIHDEMVTAIEVMDEIEDIITKFLPQVEIILYEVTELLSIFKQELLYFEEMEKSLLLVPLLAANESSLKVHFLQKNEE
ncbi:QWRF motif-containing protein 7 [Cardamine amara subsp. amara]|uniref:QWRF motif-containing protein 7 n=1 Tax=Cardamine amara subsp. amara TaxID=228776 RepID=A0ABD1A2X8_CARAN